MYDQLMQTDDPVTEYIRQVLGREATMDERNQLMSTPQHRMVIDELYRQSGGVTPGSASQSQSLVDSLYRDILQREPVRGDPSIDAGPEYHRNVLDNGGSFADMQAMFRMNRDLGERPLVEGFGQAQQMGRLATAGMNRMPGVFSDYVGMMGGDAQGRFFPEMNAANQAVMQPAGMNDWQSTMMNPILAQQQAEQQAAQPEQPANPLLSGGQATQTKTQTQVNPELDQYGNPLFR